MYSRPAIASISTGRIYSPHSGFTTPVPEPMSPIVHPLPEGLQTRFEFVLWESILG